MRAERNGERMLIQTEDGQLMHINPSTITKAMDDGITRTVHFSDSSHENVNGESYARVVAWMDRLTHV